MITKETAVKIWSCHNEIENSEKLISDMAKILSDDKEKNTPSLHNAFGERVGLQLGIPSGSNSHRLFDVNIELSVKIIEKHIEEKRKRLEELMAIATIELRAV
jgi:hypothetical protein